MGQQTEIYQKLDPSNSGVEEEEEEEENRANPSDSGTLFIDEQEQELKLKEEKDNQAPDENVIVENIVQTTEQESESTKDTTLNPEPAILQAKPPATEKH